MRFILVSWTFIAILGLVPPPGHAIAAERQEIIEQRTENTKTFKNADGTTTIEFNAEPLHYLDEAGEWQEIDTSIVDSNPLPPQNTMSAFALSPAVNPQSSYPRYSVMKNTYKACFGSTLAEPIRLEWKDKSVEFYPLNYATPSVSVEKNSSVLVEKIR